MARNFANNGLVTCATGGLAGLDGGPVTMACIIKLTDSVNGAILYAGTSTSSVSFAMEIFSNNYSFTTSAGGQNTVGGINSDNWHFAAVSKASGSSTPRGHKYVYDTNTWTHTNAAGTLADAASTPGAGGVIQLGRYATTEYINADIAIIGCWDRVLSDAEAELLPFSLQAWYHTAPVGLWILDQAATGTKVLDATGLGANESSLTVTSVSTESVPVFSYGFADSIAAGHSAGGATQNAAAAATTTATVTAVAAVDRAASATSTTTASITTAAAVDRPATAAQTTTATIAATAAVDRPTTASATTTVTLAAAAAVERTASAAFTATATITAAVDVLSPSDATAALTVTATTTVTADVVRPSAAALTATATLTATASVSTPGTDPVRATSTVTVTDRRTSTTAVTAGRTSTAAITAKRTSSGGVT